MFWPIVYGISRHTFYIVGYFSASWFWNAYSQNPASMLWEVQATWRGHTLVCLSPAPAKLPDSNSVPNAILDVQPNWAFSWFSPCQYLAAIAWEVHLLESSQTNKQNNDDDDINNNNKNKLFLTTKLRRSLLLNNK